MAVGEARIEAVGTLTADPELRFTPSGAAVVNFSVAVNGRKKEGDNWVEASTTFYRCSAWREMAENIAASLKKGDRVIALGTVKVREWESDGKSGTSVEIECDSVGPDLRFATATVVKANRSGGGQQGGGQGAWGPQQGQQQAQGGAWAAQGQAQGAPAWAAPPQGQPQPQAAPQGQPQQGQQWQGQPQQQAQPQQGQWQGQPQQGAPPVTDPWQTAGPPSDQPPY